MIRAATPRPTASAALLSRNNAGAIANGSVTIPTVPGTIAHWYLREVMAKLDAYSLTEIAQATGLSLAACSRHRAGARVPHPRHWGALLELVEGKFAP